MADRLAATFSDDDDPRFARFVLPLARLHHSRAFRSGLIILGLGGALGALVLSQFITAHWLILALMLCLPFVVLIARFGGTGSASQLRQGDFPSDVSSAEQRQLTQAVLANPPKPEHSTPHMEQLCRQTHIVLILRLLTALALVAVVVVREAIG